MKKILYTTTAFILCGIAQSQAACIATPSCTSLGYTSTSSCTNGIKCPFGNYWNCDLANKIDELEQKIEQSQGGSGGVSSTCKLGSILFSDKTCGDDVQYGKTPIGVVVYLGGSGGQALALNDFDKYYQWSINYETDIPGLTNYTTYTSITTDFASCENSKIIMAAGDESKYPAVWAVNEYSTEGTKAGDWCLPAAGIFTSYYNNQTSVNLGFERVNGTKFTSSTMARSSSEYDTNYAWTSRFIYSYGVDYYAKTTSFEVRPVIEFQMFFFSFIGGAISSAFYFLKSSLERKHL